MSIWGLGVGQTLAQGQQNVGGLLGGAGFQAQQNAMNAQQNYAQNQLGGLNIQPLTWNENVPLWSEGGYEPWLGKPSHSVMYCQRCLFL